MSVIQQNLENQQSYLQYALYGSLGNTALCGVFRCKYHMAFRQLPVDAADVCAV